MVPPVVQLFRKPYSTVIKNTYFQLQAELISNPSKSTYLSTKMKHVPHFLKPQFYHPINDNKKNTSLL